MKFRHIATCALLWRARRRHCFSPMKTAAQRFASATHSATPQAFQGRDGEPVDLISAMKTAHGKLLVIFRNGHVSAPTGSPKTAPKKYVLANAGEDAVRLVFDAAARQPRHARRTRYDACTLVRSVLSSRFEPQSLVKGYPNDARIAAAFRQRR